MNRRYTEREVRRILGDAAEDEHAAAGSAGEGLTLAEIKEIGAEVGIGPASIERAARAVRAPTPQRSSILAGGPTSLAVERRVPGEIDPDSTSEILAVIRRGMGKAGDLSQVGRLLEWRATGDLGERVVTLSSRDGVTTVSGMADLKNGVAVTFLPAGIIGFFASSVGFIHAADSGDGIGMVLFLALLPALFLVLRRLFRHWSHAELAKLERVADDLAGLIGEGAPD